MTIDDIIALAKDCAHNAAPDSAAQQLSRAVLALLTPDKPCGWDASDVTSVDSDGYVTIFEQQSMRADDALWAAVEVLRAVARAKEQGNG